MKSQNLNMECEMFLCECYCVKKKSFLKSFTEKDCFELVKQTLSKITGTVLVNWDST